MFHIPYIVCGLVLCVGYACVWLCLCLARPCLVASFHRVHTGSIRAAGNSLDELEELRVFGATKEESDADDEDAKKVLVVAAGHLQKLAADIGGSQGLLGARKSKD